MPTGGRKPLCYQLPTLLMDGTAIIVSPLIALMKDLREGLMAKGIPAAFINSSLTPEDVLAVNAHILEGNAKVISLEVQPDHIHLFVSAPPRYSPANLVNTFKGATSKRLRNRYPYLKSLPSMWT